METTPFTLDDIGWAMNSLTQAAFVIACSRLRDGGGKSFSNKKCEKRVGASRARLIFALLVFKIRSHYTI